VAKQFCSPQFCFLSQREFDIATGLEEDTDAKKDAAPNGGRYLSLQAQGRDKKKRSKKRQKKGGSVLL
jgi:hypothetical protein